MTVTGLGVGEYRLRLTVEGEAGAVARVFANHRRFLIREELPKESGRLTRDFAVAVRDAEFQKRAPYRDREITLTASGCRVTAEIERETFPVMYCLGDSTVCDQEWAGGDEKSRCCGWGQTLGLFLRNSYAVSNHAEQGTHTADCLGCHLPPVLERLREGDVVLIQFGHNDQKQPWLSADGGYKENLMKIASLVRERGGEPVICTPINRLIYVDGQLNDYLDAYAAAAREAASALGLRLIDNHAFTTALYGRLGKGAEELFYHGPDGLDRTHMNDLGAAAVGEYAAELCGRK